MEYREKSILEPSSPALPLGVRRREGLCSSFLYCLLGPSMGRKSQRPASPWPCFPLLWVQRDKEPGQGKGHVSPRHRCFCSGSTLGVARPLSSPEAPDPGVGSSRVEETGPAASDASSPVTCEGFYQGLVVPPHSQYQLGGRISCRSRLRALCSSPSSPSTWAGHPVLLRSDYPTAELCVVSREKPVSS